MVTREDRIRDIADRIIHLEGGHLSGIVDAVLANAQHMLKTLAWISTEGNSPNIGPVHRADVRRSSGATAGSTMAP